ncbi:hypothetical protein, partial [Citrobacter portucalensis]|uniref:hypothetical protein n=1 Tax=Citrobacter portucalensis TaxID=1639133 RepID=UPI00255083A9
PFRRRIDSSKPTYRQNRCCKNGSDHRFRFLRCPLEQRLADDLARKPKHQKPLLQAQWRKEIERLNAQLE